MVAVYPSKPPPSLPHPDICPRDDTVRKLAALLDDMLVVHVRGTPSSGKTTLAGLLYHHYVRLDQPVVFITGWEHVIDPIENLVALCRNRGYEDINQANLLASEFVFIIDEAQESYRDRDLWLGIIKTHSGRMWGARICLFSSYGSPIHGNPRRSPNTTPVHLGQSQRVSIKPSHIPDSPDFGLFFSRDEFKDVLDRICSHPTLSFRMESTARAYLYSMTNGHPGAVSTLTSYIYEVCKDFLRVALDVTN